MISCTMSTPPPSAGPPASRVSACVEVVDVHPCVHEYRSRVLGVLMKLLSNEFVLQHSELLDYSVVGGRLDKVGWMSKVTQVVVLKSGLIFEYELQEVREGSEGQGCKRLSLMMCVMDSVNNLNFTCVHFNLSHPRMIVDTECFLKSWMGVFCEGWDVRAGSAPLQLQRQIKQRGMVEALEREERERMNILGTALLNPEKFSGHYFFSTEVGVNLWRYFIVGSLLNDFDVYDYKSRF